MRVAVGALLLAACAQPPRPEDLSPLVGLWESAPGIVRTFVEVRPGGEVVWHSSGCEGREEGTSRGTLRDGRLHLSPPLVEYQRPAVHALHLVRAHGRDYLMTDSDLEGWREDPAPPHDFWYGMRRRLPKHELEKRLATCEDGERRLLLLGGEWLEWPLDEEGIRFLEKLAGEDRDEEVRDAAAGLLQAAAENDLDQPVGEELRKAAAAALQRVEDP